MKRIISAWINVILIIALCFASGFVDVNFIELSQGVDALVFGGSNIIASAYIIAFLHGIFLLFTIVYGVTYVTLLMYETSPFHSLGKQLSRFFTMPIASVLCVAIGEIRNIKSVLNVFDFDFVARHLWSEVVVFFVENLAFSLAALSITLISVSVLLNGYGKLENIKNYFNILWAVLCIPCAYVLGYDFAVCFKHSVGFAVFALLLIAADIVFILFYRKNYSIDLQKRFIITTLDLNSLPSDVADLLRQDEDTSPEGFRSFSDALEEIAMKDCDEDDEEDFCVFDRAEYDYIEILHPEELNIKNLEGITKEELYKEIGLDCTDEQE